MIATVLLVILACSSELSHGILVDSSTVRVNYYKNLYLSESQKLIECNSLAMLAQLESTGSTCNDSASELLLANNCPGRVGAGAQIRPLVDDSPQTKTTTVVRSTTRNLSHENDLTIRLGNLTTLPAEEDAVEKGEEHSVDEEGKRLCPIVNTVYIYVHHQ